MGQIKTLLLLTAELHFSTFSITKLFYYKVQECLAYLMNFIVLYNELDVKLHLEFIMKY